MEGSSSGFRYGNPQGNPQLYQLSPPLTSIDRFLWGQNHLSQQQTNQNNVQNEGAPISANGFFGFPSSSGALGCHAGGVWWPSLSESSSVDGLFVDRETLNFRNHNVGFNEEAKLTENHSRAVGKRPKVASPVLIKGQWTDEEDRKLIRLVKQYGVRKWSLIAEKMPARVGKQCRERWHNHLRPEIKKDSWSEEEELMLIDAHMKLGNKWAEIAKAIPGRTENSIKNHWNATKRRQNSRNANKPQVRNGIVKSSMLQDYIRSVCNPSSSTTPTPTTTPIGSLLELSNSTIDDDSPPLITPSLDDELSFMQNLFSDTYNQPSTDNNLVMGAMEAKASDDNHAHTSLAINPNGDQQLLNEMYIDPYAFFSSSPDKSAAITNTQNEDTPQTRLYSDLYLSHLPGQASSSAPSMEYFSDTMNINSAQATSKGKKEMDLVEMVSSFQFY